MPKLPPTSESGDRGRLLVSEQVVEFCGVRCQKERLGVSSGIRVPTFVLINQDYDSARRSRFGHEALSVTMTFGDWHGPEEMQDSDLVGEAVNLKDVGRREGLLMLNLGTTLPFASGNHCFNPACQFVTTVRILVISDSTKTGPRNRWPSCVTSYV